MIIEDPLILLVDDCRDAMFLMSTVFARAGLVQPLRFAHDGAETIAYLRGDGVHADRLKHPLPTVMLLDLNMPGMDGFDVLTWLRTQPALKAIRVYVLSSSSRPEDMQRAYALGASAYLLKPGNLNGLMQLAKDLLGWLKHCHFPLEASADEAEAPAVRAPRANVA